jgi:ABC-type transport system involved in cytochrome c biogenesis permease subunit
MAAAWLNELIPIVVWTWFHRLGSPRHIYGLAAWLTPWFAWTAAAASIVGGLYGGLVLAPPDYQQGDDFRIIYVHAPSAWMSLMVYTTMAASAGVGLIWRIKVSNAVAASCAPIGASFTFAALVTGSLWGERIWGTYWEWDPPDLRAHPAVSIPRVHGFAVCDGRDAAGGSRECGAGGRWRGQRADHRPTRLPAAE